MYGKINQKKDEITEGRKRFKEIAEKDNRTAEDAKVDKEFGWLDKVKEGEVVKSKYYDQMIAALPDFQKRYFEEIAAKDETKLRKEIKKL